MAAVREIAEETGLNGVVVQHLTTIEYWFRINVTRIHKYVDIFLVRYANGDITEEEYDAAAALMGGGEAEVEEEAAEEQVPEE